MADDTDNHTIKLLQEMRAEMRELRADVQNGFEEVNERFDAVNIRIDGLTHIVTLMAAHSHNLDERVEALEEVVLTE